ncbi:MAG: hypothetical protein AVDCRST_MAG11-1103, partial [uncultured Gemmatimonadaceae bacterium]
DGAAVAAARSRRHRDGTHLGRGLGPGGRARRVDRGSGRVDGRDVGRGGGVPRLPGRRGVLGGARDRGRPSPLRRAVARARRRLGRGCGSPGGHAAVRAGRAHHRDPALAAGRGRHRLHHAAERPLGRRLAGARPDGRDAGARRRAGGGDRGGARGRRGGGAAPRHAL